MARVMNFNPGPAALPLAALERAQRELVDLAGSGMSVMEHSHRGKVYEAVHNETISLVRELLGVPDTYHVLLLQGGASHQFAMVPMNFLKSGASADYVITGAWSKKALGEAKLVGGTRVAADTGENGQFRRIPKPEELELDPSASYLHITSNNTIEGTQWTAFPDVPGVPLVADMSSDLMWRPFDVSRFSLIYAGAQKNIGPSGVTLVIVRKDWVEAARKDIPAILRYATHAGENSLYNTPPCFAIYMMRNVLDELKRGGGLPAVERINRSKAELLYRAIDERPNMYSCPVDVSARSAMNVVFTLPTPDKEAAFLTGANQRGLIGLKGHRSVGGMRASIYNAVPLEWIEALTAYMRTFE